MGNQILSQRRPWNWEENTFFHCSFPCNQNAENQQEILVDQSENQVDEVHFPEEGFNVFLINCRKQALQCKIKLGRRKSRLLLVSEGKARHIEISNVESILDGSALDRVQGIPLQGDTCAAVQLKRNSAVVLLFDSKESKNNFKKCVFKLCQTLQTETVPNAEEGGPPPLSLNN